MLPPWIKKHISAYFISFVIILGLTLFIIGLTMPTASRMQLFVSSAIIQLSGVCITTAIVTIFFNYHDVKEYMAKSISALWLEGKIVSSLSAGAHTSIDKEIVISASNKQVKAINESLYQQVTLMRNKVLSDFILTNYSINIHYADYPGSPEMIVRHIYSTYRINTLHFMEPKKVFPLQLVFQLNVSRYASLTNAELVKSFEYKVGAKQFTNSNVKFEDETNGTIRVVTCKFFEEIEIKGYADVELKLTTLSLKSSNHELCFMRYPTQGLSVSLHYTTGYDYEGTILKPANLQEGNAANNESINQLSDGIIIKTNDWILPGYGAVLGYYPKQVNA